MKLSNIILEVKRIPEDQESYVVPVIHPLTEKPFNLQFTKRSVDFGNKTDSAQINKLTQRYLDITQTVNHYINVTTSKEQPRGAFQDAYFKNYKGISIKDTMDTHPEYFDMPAGKVLKMLKVKHNIDLLGALSSNPGFYSNPKGEHLKMKITDLPSKNGGRGIYNWVINGEVKYVGLSNDFSQAPGRDYTDPATGHSLKASRGPAINFHALMQTSKATTPEELSKSIRVYTAEVPYEEEMSNVEFRKKVLEPIEKQVMMWQTNIDSGKADISKKKDTPGRGTDVKTKGIWNRDIPYER